MPCKGLRCAVTGFLNLLHVVVPWTHDVVDVDVDVAADANTVDAVAFVAVLWQEVLRIRCRRRRRLVVLLFLSSAIVPAVASATCSVSTTSAVMTTSRYSLSTSLAPPKTIDQGMSVCNAPSLVERLHVDKDLLQFDEGKFVPKCNNFSDKMRRGRKVVQTFAAIFLLCHI